MATSSTSRRAGFGHVALIIVIVVVTLVAAIGVVVYKRSNAKNNAVTPPSSNPPAQQPMASPPQQPVNPYEGMTKYTNEKYGFSFYHPADWRVEEGDQSLATDAQKKELLLWLVDTNTEVAQYTAGVTVNNRDFATHIGIVDGMRTHGGAPDTLQFTKTAQTIQEKNSFKYVIPQGGNVDRVWHIIEVGSKTYTIETIDEEDNVERTPDYMVKFNKLVESLTLP